MKIGVKGIIGTSLAILVGVISLLLGIDRGISLIISLLVEIIVLQIDFSDYLRKEYDDLVVGLNLSRAINRNPDLVGLLESLVQHLGLLETSYQLFRKQAFERLIDFVDEIKNMHAGVMEISSPQEIELEGLWLLEHLGKSLFATAITYPKSYWITNEGVDYHRKNMEAVNRKCAITRVFILDSATGFDDPRFVAMLKEQKKAGVDVRYVLASALPEQANLDFGIWDDSMVCYLTIGPDGVHDAKYHTSSAELQKARKLRDVILNVAKVFTLEGAEAIGSAQPTTKEGMLLYSAKKMEDLARKHCYGGHVNPTDCKWYHESWQYLSLLGMVVTPQECADDFFLPYLAQLAGTSEHLDILISGLADYEMLAVVLEGIGRPNVKRHSITVLDLCPTPLMIAEWFAQTRGVSVVTKRVDAKKTGFSDQSFDVIVTDTFLTKLTKGDQKAVTAEWHRILRTEGRVITTLHVAESSNGLSATRDQVRNYVEKAEGLAIERKYLGLDPLVIRRHATDYVTKNISYPVKDEDEVRLLFKGFETTVIEKRPVAEYTAEEIILVVAVKFA